MPTGSRGPFVRGRGSLSATAAESAARASRGRCCASWGPARGEKALPSVPNLRPLLRRRCVSAPQSCPQASTHWSCGHCGWFPVIGEGIMAAHSARQCGCWRLLLAPGRPAGGPHFGGSPSRPSGEPRQRGGLGGACGLRVAQLQRSKLSCTDLGEGQQGKRRKRGALPHLRARRPCAWVQRVSDDTSGP